MKLNFERAVLLAIVLIVPISTANMFWQYIPLMNKDENVPIEYINKDQSGSGNRAFQTLLLKADSLYAMQNYKDAAAEYVSMIYNVAINSEQKIYANYRLGMCYYYLKDYAKSSESFVAAAEANNNDALAYNNAAISAFMMKDYNKAVTYEKEAMSSLPVVEYYYNLGRIYETMGNYEDAARNYIAVSKGEENITYIDRIDPIRIKNKIVRLFPDKEKRNELSQGIVIALKLKDSREAFLIDDSTMEIKSADFKWQIESQKGSDKLYCNYDKIANDPYNMIEAMLWTVKSGGKTVFTGSKDNFSLKIDPSKKYTIDFKIDYSGGKEKLSSRVIQNRIAEPDIVIKPDPVVKPAQICQYYNYAVYEQVFEKGFKLSTKGLVDRFGTVWGKDDIATEIMEKDSPIDSGTSLYINNTSEDDAGLWANLDTLLKDKNLKGKTVGIRFYARQITENPQLTLQVRVRVDQTYDTHTNYFYLDNRWQQMYTKIKIPQDADGFTISFKVNPGEEIKLDGFIITIIN